VISVGFGGTTTLLMIVTLTGGFKNEASLDSNAQSIIRSIENFKIVEFAAVIVVCIMPTKLTPILIYRAIKNLTQQITFSILYSIIIFSQFFY
jgi:hypothetical protein